MSYSKVGIVDDLAVIQAGILAQLKREMDYAILHNPWIWSPDPLVHSIRWMQRHRVITFRRIP